MSFLARLFGSKQEPRRKLSVFIIGLASQAAQATEREIQTRLGRGCSEAELQRMFALYAFFAFHLTCRVANRVLSPAHQEPFRHNTRETFLHEFVATGIDPAATETERMESQHAFDTLLAEFEVQFAPYQIPEGGAAVMMPASLPWEFGRRMAAELNWGATTSAIEPGFIGALASMNQVDTMAKLVRAAAP